MAIEYKMTLRHERKIQPLVVIFTNKIKSLIALGCAIVAAVLVILGFTNSITFLRCGVPFLFATGYFLYSWMNKSRMRALAMARLYRGQEKKVFTYTLSENDGIIKDFCHETGDSSENKRSKIDRVIAIRGTLYVLYYSGKVSTYPNTKEIKKFFKG